MCCTVSACPHAALADSWIKSTLQAGNSQWVDPSSSQRYFKRCVQGTWEARGWCVDCVSHTPAIVPLCRVIVSRGWEGLNTDTDRTSALNQSLRLTTSEQHMQTLEMYSPWHCLLVLAIATATEVLLWTLFRVDAVHLIAMNIVARYFQFKNKNRNQ